MGDFLAFRRYLTPTFIQVIFWLAGAVLTIVLLIQGIDGMSRGGGGGVIVGLLTIILGIPLMWVFVRVYCEILIVFFRILEMLQSIDQKTR